MCSCGKCKSSWTFLNWKKLRRRPNSTSLKTQRSTVLHFWNNGIRSPTIIARLMKIPAWIVKYNIAEIKRQVTARTDATMVHLTSSLPTTTRHSVSRFDETTRQCRKNRRKSCFRTEVARYLVGRYSAAQANRLKNTLPHAKPMLAEK